MTREEAKDLFPILQAYADGKTVQFYSRAYQKWIEVGSPGFSTGTKYRIKPEPIRIIGEVVSQRWNDDGLASIRLEVDPSLDSLIGKRFQLTELIDPS